jgi:hypothetical protein
MNTQSLTDQEIHHAIQAGFRPKPAPEPPPQRAPKPAGNATDIPQTVDSLRRGHLDAALDSASTAVQTIARLYWATEPPTFWILAQSLAQGEAFPFRPALQAHLDQSEGRATAILLESPLVRHLASAIALTHQCDRLRLQALLWESTSRRAWMPLPSTAQFAAHQALPTVLTHAFEDGLELTLAPVTELVLVATQPAANPQQHYNLQLIGNAGFTRHHALNLEPVGAYSGARLPLGDLLDATHQLGPHCVIVLSSTPPPDWLALAQSDSQ